jgi:serine phosphatase RsbU (regulator of sigma subunit)
MSLQLKVGDCLVGLTDGLVERRGQDIDEGIERARQAGRGGGRSAEQIVDRVVASASAEEGHDDDVTVLAIRRT